MHLFLELYQNMQGHMAQNLTKDEKKLHSQSTFTIPLAICHAKHSRWSAEKLSSRSLSPCWFSKSILAFTSILSSLLCFIISPSHSDGSSTSWVFMWCASLWTNDSTLQYLMAFAASTSILPTPSLLVGCSSFSFSSSLALIFSSCSLLLCRYSLALSSGPCWPVSSFASSASSSSILFLILIWG